MVRISLVSLYVDESWYAAFFIPFCDKKIRQGNKRALAGRQPGAVGPDFSRPREDVAGMQQFPCLEHRLFLALSGEGIQWRTENRMLDVAEAGNK
ncbi:hypothetical protein [Kerstersia sp.]|uniref:hypothetical protein n=1 Tax=Kerstersia sp. TaxID=1930783 RepID=UPI003F922270